MYFHNADFLTLCKEVIHNFFCRVAYRAHCYDDFLCVRCAVVIERFIVCADFGIDFFHISVDDIRSLKIRRVARFSVLEESFRLFSRTHAVRVCRVNGAGFESLYSVPVDHFLQILVIPDFDFLVFVRCSETVKEVKHRQLSCDSGKMCYCCKVHSLLYRI